MTVIKWILIGAGAVIVAVAIAIVVWAVKLYKHWLDKF